MEAARNGIDLSNNRMQQPLKKYRTEENKEEKWRCVENCVGISRLKIESF
jgi:hypothetical protein